MVCRRARGKRSLNRSQVASVSGNSTPVSITNASKVPVSPTACDISSNSTDSSF